MKDRKAMKTRRILAIICYTIGFCAWCSGICLLVIMERDYIRQARVSHLSAHMDSIILVQHIFLSACLQGEKRRLQAMGYQKKGKARFERHFNGAERSASLLLDICVCFAVY